MPKTIPVVLDLRRSLERIEATIGRHADRVIAAQGQSEGRLRENIQGGVNFLDQRIQAGGGYGYQPYVYPPRAGIMATPRGAYFMGDGHAGGHSSGSGGGFLSAIGGAVVILLILFGIIALARCLSGNVIGIVAWQHVEATAPTTYSHCNLPGTIWVPEWNHCVAKLP